MTYYFLKSKIWQKLYRKKSKCMVFRETWRLERILEWWWTVLLHRQSGPGSATIYAQRMRSADSWKNAERPGCYSISAFFLSSRHGHIPRWQWRHSWCWKLWESGSGGSGESFSHINRPMQFNLNASVTQWIVLEMLTRQKLLDIMSRWW